MKTSVVFVISIPLGLNHVDRLRYTLHSLDAQTRTVKIGFCEAGNNHKASELADEYAHLIDYRRHGRDDGQSDAINEGWRNVEGDIYSWLNADDYLAPGALDRVAQLFVDHPEVDVIYGQSLIFATDRICSGLHPAVNGDIGQLSHANIVSQPSCFYRKRVLDELGMLDCSLRYTMDWELWVRFHLAGRQFLYVPEVFSTVLWEVGTKTSSINIQRLGELWRLTSTNNGYWRSFKTFIGFLLHYSSEYSIVKYQLHRLLHWLRPQDVAKRGSWLLSEEERPVVIPIYHFLDEPVKSIKLRFARPVSGSIIIGSLTVSKKKCTVFWVSQRITAGTIYPLTLYLSPTDIEELVHIEFVT